MKPVHTGKNTTLKVMHTGRVEILEGSRHFIMLSSEQIPAKLWKSIRRISRYLNCSIAHIHYRTPHYTFYLQKY